MDEGNIDVRCTNINLVGSMTRDLGKYKKIKWIYPGVDFYTPRSTPGLKFRTEEPNQKK